MSEKGWKLYFRPKTLTHNGQYEQAGGADHIWSLEEIAALLD
jgi:hypothetical protein